MTDKTHFDLIRDWAADRNLIEGSDPKSQFLKLAEEMGELADAMAKDDEALIKDAIGDMMVVQIILAAQMDMKAEKCLTDVYDVIKKRKGNTVNGVFVKEANDG